MVVEDDSTNREFLRRALEKNGCAVDAVEGVEAALKMFSQRGIQWFDTVLTDFQMPGQTGLDLIEWINDQDACLTGIILTGESDRAILKKSLRAGVSVFLEKPVNLQKLIPALNKAVDTTHRQRQLAKTMAAVKTLGQTQRSLINSRPVAVPGGEAVLELVFHPKLEAGGDFLNCFQPEPDRLCCLLTDVAGHDLQAAYVFAHFQGVVRGMIERAAPLPEIFSFFNRFLLDEWKRSGQFRMMHGPGVGTSLAAISLLMDFTTQTVDVVACGMPAPYYISTDGRAEQIGSGGGAPLGWFPELELRGSQHPFQGGSLLFWTDGLDDLAIEKQLHPLALFHAFEHARRSGQDSSLLEDAVDDVLCARLHLPGASSDFIPFLHDAYHGAQAGDIDQLEERWRRHLQFMLPEMPRSNRHDLILAVREAVLNGLKHGCGGDPEKICIFELAFSPGTRIVRARVADPGPGHQFDFVAHAEAAAAQTLDEHRGLIFIHNLSQTVRLERNGATVIMEFNL